MPIQRIHLNYVRWRQLTKRMRSNSGVLIQFYEILLRKTVYEQCDFCSDILIFKYGQFNIINILLLYIYIQLVSNNNPRANGVKRR